MTSHLGRKAIAPFAALTLVLGACGPAAQVQMVGGTSVAASIGSANVPVGVPVSVGSMTLCVTAPGRATIQSVAMREPTGDIVIEAFATRPNPFTRGRFGVGNAKSSIVDLHLDLDPAAPAIVSGTCPAEGSAMSDVEAAGLVELVVQVVRRSGTDAGASALDITYEIDGRARTSVIPFGIWLCQATCPPESESLYRS
jgi:hypothetical protein